MRCQRVRRRLQRPECGTLTPRPFARLHHPVAIPVYLLRHGPQPLGRHAQLGWHRSSRGHRACVCSLFLHAPLLALHSRPALSRHALSCRAHSLWGGRAVEGVRADRCEPKTRE